jgi:hypothetical protein
MDEDDKTVPTLSREHLDQLSDVISSSFLGKDKPPELSLCEQPFDTIEELTAWMSESLRNNPNGSSTMHLLAFKREDGGWTSPCFTGNGPNAKNNAQFFWLASQWFPSMAVEILAKSASAGLACMKLKQIEDILHERQHHDTELMARFQEIVDVLVPCFISGSRVRNPQDIFQEVAAMLPPDYEP